MAKLLVFIDNCNRALNSGKSLQDYINSIKNNPLNLQARADCENFGKALDLMLSCLESIFAGGTLSGPIDLSNIDYLSNDSELLKSCSDTDDNNINIGESHVMMVYGYKENSDNTIDIYVKNTWSGGGATSDRFIIKIKMILSYEKKSVGIRKIRKF